MTIRLPKGKKCAVCLTFDFDALSLWIGTFGYREPGPISRGEFGARVGIYRILELLDKHGIKGTFFVPGHTIDTFPQQVKLIHEKGHEIAYHGYCHELPSKLTYEAEREVMSKAMQSILQVTGSNPVGCRTPFLDVSPHTIPLLLEHRFVYTSNFMADDFRPYRLRQGDEISVTGPYKFGKEIALIDFPVQYFLYDTVVLEFSYPTMENRMGLPASSVLEIWCDEFNYMYKNVERGVFTLGMHPFSIGQAYRMRMLEKFIRFVKGYEGSWFTRMDELAKAWVD